MTAPNRIGIAAWQSGDSIWRVEARGGVEGVAIHVDDTPFLLRSSDDQPLPTLAEQYVRGDELHLSFPQFDDLSRGQCDFGFRLVIRPVAFGSFVPNQNRCVFELLVSVQTTLLDAHPTLDLVSPADQVTRLDGDGLVTNAVHLADNKSFSAAVLLGPQDAPFTSVVEDPGALRLRLFGEFLEKGVIRRARPWVVLDRSGSGIDAEFVRTSLDTLATSPLPLA
ncbi:MAG: hypothetical protein KDB00_27240 [Planctomycetales bacterium]|nr:hypothetical protein [Planctomycetales bacterium]